MRGNLTNVVVPMLLALMCTACPADVDYGPLSLSHSASPSALKGARGANLPLEYVVRGSTTVTTTQNGCSQGQERSEVSGLGGAKATTTLTIADTSIATIGVKFQHSNIATPGVSSGDALVATYKSKANTPKSGVNRDPSFVFHVFCVGDGTTTVTLSTEVDDYKGKLEPLVVTVQCDPSGDWSGEELLEPLIAAADILEIPESEQCEWVLDTFSKSDTVHTDIDVESKAKAGDHTQSANLAAGQTSLSQDVVDEVFNGTTDRAAPVYPCGDGPNATVLCTPGHRDFPAGEVLIVANLMFADIPLDDPVNTYQYGFVFDADGNPANNYVPSAQYANDFFSDTDLWYVAAYTPVGGWTLDVTEARGGDFVGQESDARLIVIDNGLILVVPASEFEAADPALRWTAFRHTGDYGMGPTKDWNGDVQPAVAQGLFTW